MTTKDWRPTAAYLYILNLDSSGLAWEYLRRNLAYLREWNDRGQGHSAPNAEHWGLQFRRRPIS